jgi:DNA-directed RNA polymerase subunit RPC12/RpoP
MSLALVESPPFVCLPWRIRDREEADHRHPIGVECVECGREVALPQYARRRDASCLYCGLNRGLVRAVEVEIGEDWRAKTCR